MQITVVAVQNQTVPTSKGSYQALEVTYKDGFGKIASKKIMSFVKESKAAFDTLVDAKGGETFTIQQVKDAQDKYWVWTSAARGTAGAAPAATTVPATTNAKGGSWETSEERAKKQIYIIRQSSLSTAVATLSVGSKSAPKDSDILALAKKFEDYVFDGLTGDFATDTKSLEDPDLFNDVPN